MYDRGALMEPMKVIQDTSMTIRMQSGELREGLAATYISAFRMITMR